MTTETTKLCPVSGFEVPIVQRFMSATPEQLAETRTSRPAEDGEVTFVNVPGSSNQKPRRSQPMSDNTLTAIIFICMTAVMIAFVLSGCTAPNETGIAYNRPMGATHDHAGMGPASPH